MTDIQNEDDIWIQQTLTGDRNAFSCLIRKYQDQLFDLAFRILGSRPEAEDILQDSFIAAYRNLAKFNHRSKFLTWIYSIVLNHIRNRLRHNKVLKWSSLDARPTTDDGEIPFELPEKAEPMDVVMERKLQVEAIKREVKTLPLQYQSMFIMHYFQDLPLDDIAKRLNRPIGTVKVYLHRSRKLLYKRLATKAPQTPQLEVASARAMNGNAS